MDQHLALPHFSSLICHLGENKLREWLVHHPDSTVDTSRFDLEAIQIKPVCRPKGLPRSRLRSASMRKSSRGTRTPSQSLSEPITLKMKKGTQPQSLPQPRWTVVQKEIVQRWAEEGLRNGSLEPSTSAWASRVHLVLKPPANQTAELADLKDCKLRP